MFLKKKFLFFRFRKTRRKCPVYRRVVFRGEGYDCYYYLNEFRIKFLYLCGSELCLLLLTQPYKKKSFDSQICCQNFTLKPLKDNYLLI